MTEAWIEYLAASGAIISDGAVIDFGDREAELNAIDDGIITDLSHRGLIAVRGEDAVSFLQGQLTCDMHALDESHSLLGAWCSPGGRVLTLCRLLLHGADMIMQLPHERLQPTLERLRLFVLRARVELDDLSGKRIQMGLCGDTAAALISAEFGAQPEQPGQVLRRGGARVIRLGSGPRFEAFFDNVEAAKAFWQKSCERLTQAGVHAWDLLDIFDGLPRITEPDEYLPQMLNLDLLGGMSFSKGCYVGQEIIARTHHLGHLKRRMFCVGFDSETPPANDAPLFLEGAGKDHDADGRLLLARRRPGGGYAALAVIKSDSVGQPLRLGTGDGVPVAILPLPYSGLRGGA
jgi:hypothetical protein